MKNFTFQIIIRILLLTTATFIGVYFAFSSSYLECFVAIVICILIVVSLLRYIHNTNRQVVEFLRGINYSDFLQNVRIGLLGGSFKELAEEMNKVLIKFKQTRFEKEESLHYLQTVVEHVSVGLISFNQNGDIELFNRAAKKSLKISHLKNILTLDDTYPGFGKFLFHLNNNSNKMYKLSDKNEMTQLMIHCTTFRMNDQNLKLISMYNIQSKLEETEIEAWQKLIRVLTHEIMNSIAPISSLSATASNILRDNYSNNFVNDEPFTDISDALHTIHKRSEGLMDFVNKFRDISKIPKPQFTKVNVADLFYRIRLLTESLSGDKKINFSFSVEPVNLEIPADQAMIEQVLINLIKNSVQALKESENGKIKLSAQINDRGRAIIKVIDNGPGIPEDNMDKVFVPFYSTKKDGSGVGLSISQSIIRAHNGSLWVQSKPNDETIFNITL